MKKRFVSVHVDVDSPVKLSKCWVAEDRDYGPADLDHFYETAFSRVLNFFDDHNVEVTHR